MATVEAHDAMYRQIGGETGLKITDAAFTKVAWHLTMTLDELVINRSLSMIINGFVEGVRGQVVTA